jgi:hypothetical protein
MKYFETLPSIITTDYNNNLVLLKNLLARAVLLPQVQNNPLLLYSYAIQDGDTPEIVAHKYYGNVDRYWIVLHGNQSLDPQWDWPLTSQQFQKYIVGKYKQDTANSLNISVSSTNESQILSYTLGTVHHYEKTITTRDNVTQTQAVKTITIDKDTYDSTTITERTATFSDGSTSIQSTTKDIVSVYNHENNLNEAKRNIKLINSSFAGPLELQLKSLMSR